jgi:hypothetical protein
MPGLARSRRRPGEKRTGSGGIWAVEWWKKDDAPWGEGASEKSPAWVRDASGQRTTVPRVETARKLDESGELHRCNDRNPIARIPNPSPHHYYGNIAPKRGRDG